MWSERFWIRILFMALFFMMLPPALAQKEGSKQSRKNKGGWPQVKLKDKREKRVFKGDSTNNNAIIEEYERLRKKYKLTKAEQNAIASARRGYPMNKRAKRLARRARRKEAKMREELNEFIEEQIRESQPREVRKRIRRSKRRASRFRRTGSYLPWYKRWWYKLTGEF